MSADAVDSPPHAGDAAQDAADSAAGDAVARLYGEPLFALPQDLYIPPDALEVFLEAFEGPWTCCSTSSASRISTSSTSRCWMSRGSTWATWTRSAAATWNWRPNTC